MRTDPKFYVRQPNDTISLYDVVSEQLDDSGKPFAPRRFLCRNGATDVNLPVTLNQQGLTGAGALTFEIAASGLPVGEFVSANLSQSISMFLAEISNASLSERIEIREGQSAKDVKPTKKASGGETLQRFESEDSVSFYRVRVELSLDLYKRFCNFLGAVSTEPFTPGQDQFDAELDRQCQLGDVAIKSEKAGVGRFVFSTKPLLLSAIPVERSSSYALVEPNPRAKAPAVGPTSSERRIETVEPAIVEFLRGDSSSKNCQVEKNDGLVYQLGFAVLERFRPEFVDFSGSSDRDSNAEEVFNRVARLTTWLEEPTGPAARELNPLARRRVDLVSFMVESLGTIPPVTAQVLALTGNPIFGADSRSAWTNSDHFFKFVSEWAKSLEVRRFTSDDEVLISAWSAFAFGLTAGEISSISTPNLLRICITLNRTGLGPRLRTSLLWRHLGVQVATVGQEPDDEIAPLLQALIASILATGPLSPEDLLFIDRVLLAAMQHEQEWPLSEEVWLGVGLVEFSRVFSPQVLGTIVSIPSLKNSFQSLLRRRLAEPKKGWEILAALEIRARDLDGFLVREVVESFERVERSDDDVASFVAALIGERVLALRMTAEDSAETERNALLGKIQSLEGAIQRAEEETTLAREEAISWKRVAEGREAGDASGNGADSGLHRAFAEVVAVATNVVQANVADLDVRDAFELRLSGALDAFGIKSFGAKGDSVPFDSTFHRLNRGVADAGTPVVVIAPGFARQMNNVQEVLVHAIVRNP